LKKLLHPEKFNILLNDDEEIPTVHDILSGIDNNEILKPEDSSEEDIFAAKFLDKDISNNEEIGSETLYIPVINDIK